MAKPIGVLFLCTENAARSQVAEALLDRRGRGVFQAASAGSRPAPRVHLMAVDALREFGIEWGGRVPKGLDAVASQSWDLIITLCDRARETCPSFPGRPVYAHWRVADPAVVVGDEVTRRRGYREVVVDLAKRIDFLLLLPMDKVEAAVRECREHAPEGAPLSGAS